GGADVILELVGAPNVPADLEALAMKGRLVIVGTGAGADAQVSLRALMGRRSRILGTVLRARPLEEKAAAIQAFGHQIVPALADGRLRGFVERVFRVAPRKPVTRPRDRRRADGAVREPQHDRRRVLDVAALARALRERIRARGRLHRDDLAGDRTLEIDAVARALEQVAAALG